MRGMPDDPQLGVLDAPPSLEQHVDALVRAQQAEEQHDRRLSRRERLRDWASGGRSRGASNAPWGMTCTRAGSSPSSPAGDRGRARSARRPRRSARTDAAAPRSCPGRGSRGRTSWAVSTSGRRAPDASGGGQQVAHRGAARTATGSARRPPRARRGGSAACRARARRAWRPCAARAPARRPRRPR